MRVHPLVLVLSCALACAVAGCNTGKGVSNGSTHGSLRVVNLIPNAGGPVNVTFDNEPFATGLPFEGMTPYQQIDAGLREVTMSVAGSNTNVVDIIPTFLPDNAYTLVAIVSMMM